MKRATAGVFVVAAALLGLGVSSAPAAVGDLSFAGCLANNAAQGCVDLPNSPGGYGVAVSPDGRSVYTVGYQGATAAQVAIFDRAADGSLSYRGCLGNDAGEGCVDLPGAPIRGANAVTVSPDGGSVYVAAFNSSSVTHFFRAADGGLAFEGCDASTAADGCADVGGANAPLQLAANVAVSPDGATVYVEGNGSNSAAGGRVARFSADAQGRLTFTSCLSDSGDQGCAVYAPQSLYGIGGIVATAGQVFELGPSYSAINRLSAGLSFSSCLTDGLFPLCGSLPLDPGLMRDLALSPDGGSLYTVGTASGYGLITQLAVGPGSMTWSSCLGDSMPGCIDLPNSPLGSPNAVAVSPDGASLYVAGGVGGDISTFRRSGDGTLSFAGCLGNDLSQGCAVVPGAPLASLSDVAVSPDGRNVYATTFDTRALAVFNRETPSSSPPPGSLSLDLSARKKARVGKLRVTATCSTACELEVQAKGRAGKKFKSKRLATSLEPGVRTKLKLKLKGRTLRKVDDRKGRVRFDATATAGGLTATDSAKAKLRP